MAANSWCRFGCSYDPAEDPTSTRFYVDIFMDMIHGLKLPEVHLLGHHAGSGIALEMAAVYPDQILTVALSAPALATSEMQASMFVTIAAEWSRPKEDGSHLMKVWNMLSPLIPDLDIKNHEVLDALRAWRGRDQSYKVLFKQNKIGFYEQITCPILAMCSKEDVLWPCFRFCSELVSIPRLRPLRYSLKMLTLSLLNSNLMPVVRLRKERFLTTMRLGPEACHITTWTSWINSVIDLRIRGTHLPHNILESARRSSFDFSNSWISA